MKSRLNYVFNPHMKSRFVALGLTSGFIGTYLFSKYKPTVYAETTTKQKLPTYTMTDVAKHTTKETGYWLAYKDGVYDITTFVDNHPGGKQVLRTAGKALESCWKVFTIHRSDDVHEILEEYRIGNLSAEDIEKNKNNAEKFTDLFEHDPRRENAAENFFIRSEKPFNAETKPSILVSEFITPVDKFYIRNHMHVPVVNMKEYKLEIKNQKETFTLTYDELIEKYKSHTITSALQCAGNRRSAMNNQEQGHVQGTSWYVGAVGNARWTGVKLSDVLESFGLDKEGKHVQFVGLDCDASNKCYGASIPIERAFSDDVLIAYKMNDETLTNDHGFPLRVFVPGAVGARSVKWVNQIIISDKESDSHWQIADYKILPPTVKQPQQADYDCVPSLQEVNVQSAICSPSSNEDGNKIKILSVKPDNDEIKNKKLTVKGYALSGGGRRIQNVQISLDNGKNWKQAEMEQIEQPYMRSWAWTLWTCKIPFEDLPSQPFDIVCRAMDVHSNCQPDSPLGIWNIRGLMNNAWHKITIEIDKNIFKKSN